MKYKREDHPDVEKILQEAREREKQRPKALMDRSTIIEEKKVERIDEQTGFILHRAELSTQIQGHIKELGAKEPLAEVLKWLHKNVESSSTAEELNRYEESFKKSTLPKVKTRL